MLAHDRQRVNFVCCDLADYLATYPNEYDIIVASSVLEYIENYPTILSAIVKRLKSGGFFVFSLPNRDGFHRRVESLAYRVFGKPAYLSTFLINRRNERCRVLRPHMD